MIRTVFRIPRPRHPLARLVWIVVGAIAAIAALVLGAIVLAVLVAGGALWMLWRALRNSTQAPPANAETPRAPADTLDGEFTVLSRPLDQRRHA